MRLLSIETSCDETAAAIVESSEDNQSVRLISHSLATSLAQHATTGGIIPENAARAQIHYIIPTIYEALEKAGLLANRVARLGRAQNSSAGNEVTEASFEGEERQDPHKQIIPDIDAIAVTYGPGLIGSLLVGVETAKTLSYIWNKPLIPVNHLFGHMYANWLMVNGTWQIENGNHKAKRAISHKPFTPPVLPAVVLIVSGGHTDLLLMRSHTDITWLGGTRDDAAGEAFDKIGRLLGLSYPAGPVIETLAQKGDPKAYHFPRPLLNDGSFDFSFSGLKTAVLREVEKIKGVARLGGEERQDLKILNNQKISNISRGVQDAISDVLVKKTLRAVEKFGAKSIILSGGVAANQTLVSTFKQSAIRHTPYASVFVPPKTLCTDNAAMIGAAAIFRNQTSDWQTLTANPQLYFD